MIIPYHSAFPGDLARVPRWVQGGFKKSREARLEPLLDPGSPKNSVKELPFDDKNSRAPGTSLQFGFNRAIRPFDLLLFPDPPGHVSRTCSQQSMQSSVGTNFTSLFRAFTRSVHPSFCLMKMDSWACLLPALTAWERPSRLVRCLESFWRWVIPIMATVQSWPSDRDFPTGACNAGPLHSLLVTFSLTKTGADASSQERSRSAGAITIVI